MLAKLEERRGTLQDESAFTLIELLVVLIIIGVLRSAGLVAPYTTLLAAWMHEYRREIAPPSAAQRLALMPLFAALAPVGRRAGLKSQDWPRRESRRSTSVPAGSRAQIADPHPRR